MSTVEMTAIERLSDKSAHVHFLGTFHWGAFVCRSQKCPKHTVKIARVIGAPIKRYMGFADSFKPPTLGSSLQLNNFEFFILKHLY